MHAVRGTYIYINELLLHEIGGAFFLTIGKPLTVYSGTPLDGHMHP